MSESRQKGKHVRRKLHCECSLRIRSLKNMSQHLKARGHVLAH
jgi:hypothetical protein